jgi:pimeloyl-ACP methyl ester carboxylesterase
MSEQLGDVRETTLSAGRVRYHERGEGPPLVFVHGLLTNAELWRDVVPELAGSFRCLSPNWPLGSHPLPMRPDADLTPPGVARLIDEFLAELGLERAILIANDTGGALAQLVATRYPSRLGGLVLNSCDCFTNFFPPMFRYLQLLARVPGGPWAIANTLRIPALRTLPLAYGWLANEMPRQASDSYVTPGLRSADIRRDTAKFLRAVSNRYTLRAAEELRGFEAPALVVWGEDDRFFPVADGRRLAELLPNGRFETIPGARTFAPADQPKALAALIGEFAAEITR